MTLFDLAARNVARRRKRYAPAFFNLALFGLVFTVLAGVGDSALANLEARAEVYYGGQGTLLTYRLDEAGWDDAARPAAEVADRLRSLAWVRGVQARHVFRQPGTEVVADGRSSALRLVVGVDDEPGLADRYDLAEGRPRPGRQEVVLPASTTRQLGLRSGDPVTLSLRTYPGQRNTVRLTVAGIYHDDPVFGRGVAFADRSALNLWSAKPAAYASENPLWIEGSLTADRLTEVQRLLEKDGALWAHPADKRLFLKQYLTEHWSGQKSVLFSLEDHTKDLQAALTALRWGLQGVSLLLLAAAALGLGSTLRVLLHERTVELGTLRALGMTEERAFGLLVLEVELVASAAVVSGGILGVLTLQGLSSIDLFQYSMIEPLLKNGSLGYRTSILPGLTAWVFALVTVYLVARPLVLPSVVGPPARALGGLE